MGGLISLKRLSFKLAQEQLELVDSALFENKLRNANIFWCALSNAKLL